MRQVEKEKSWVLSAAMVIIPIVLVILALWLWPVMRTVYSLPDSAVATYQKALNHAVPPGTGRITRTAIIEQALAHDLGQLSNHAVLPGRQDSAGLLAVLRYNARLGRWAAAVMTFPRNQRVAMFNWGLQDARLSVVNQAFSRWSIHRVAAISSLTTLPGPFADAIMERLLNDHIFWVRFSVMAALFQRQPTATEMVILRRWATEKHLEGIANHREWKLFLFGREAVNSVPALYRMNRQTDLTDTRRFAATLLAHWKPTATAPAKTKFAAQMNKRIAPSAAAAPVHHESSKADMAALRAGMRDFSRAMANLKSHYASAKPVKAALAAQYRTLIKVTSAMPWQKQLLQIMNFNAAMSRWIYIIAQLPPQQSRAMFNWVRFRRQDVELMRLTMSQRPAQRLRAAVIAPKLHGTERVWLVHRLLMDQSVTVELSMLHELWNMPPSPGLKKMLLDWTNIEPLPKGRQPHRITINGKQYVVNRTIALQRFRQARQIGAKVLQRWNK